MEGAANFTMTECGTCNQTSDVDEAMISCDSCQVWYHIRCVGVVSTADYTNKDWFCPAEVCQQQMAERQKKKQEAAKKASKSKKGSATDDSDRSSLKSDRQSGSTLERKLKALAEEQKAKEREMEMERILLEKRLEMERVLREKRLKMEMEMRNKEMQQEQDLLAHALQEEMAHLDRMKKIRAMFNGQMESVQQQIKGIKPKSQGDNDDRKGAKDSHKLLRNASDVNKEEYTQNEVEKKASDAEDDYPDTSDSENECDTNNDSKSETEEELSHLKQEKETNPHGLGQQPCPTKAQLSARHGITRKLPIFSGQPEEWPLFIGSYQASNEACGYNDVENLVRLQECLKGRALESVRGQLLLPKSVPKAICKLRELYGRPEQLLQFHLEKIRKLEPPKSERLASFIPFGNAVEQLCEHLEATELTQHLLNPLLIQDLVDKLPANDKREWVRYKKRRQVVTLRTFTDFLSRIVSEACEANVSVEFKPDSKSASAGKSGRSKTHEKSALYHHSNTEGSTSSLVSKDKQKPCKACQRTDHRLRFCQDFKNMSPADRIKAVDQWKLCRVCLNDHGKSPCKFNIRCNVNDCRERHHPLLHSTEQAVAINNHIRTSNSVLFRMVPVMLHCGAKTVDTLAFLDEGASATLIEKSLAVQLGIKGIAEQFTIKWTADITRVEKDSMRMNLWISAQNSEKKLLLQTVRTVGELMLPKQTISASEIAAQYKFLEDLPIASYTNKRPGLLIGLNNIHAFAPVESRIGEIGEPIAVRSKLGWTVYGPNRETALGENFIGHHHISNEELHNLLKSYYALEESSIAVLPESKENKRAREILERTTVRIGNRFETGLLWKIDNPVFPNSFLMAFRRLKHLEQKLAKNPELYQNVRNQISEYQEKGYAHRATAEELASTNPGKVWYLPLNVVLNSKKPGKVRLVWDAAASVNEISLNSQLLKGPDLLTPLTAVINRFRERRIAFGGDIREMYHQLRIRSDDKQVQRFLFRDDPESTPVVYVMDVATFGSTSSPCSAQFVKNLNAKEFSEDYPDAAAAIIDKHYVDDYFDSVDTIEEAVQRGKEVRLIHSKAGFVIRNWVSNSEEVLHCLGEPKVDQTIHFNRDKATNNERVLGIIWNPSSDVFSFSTEHRETLYPYLKENNRPTKRIVLSCVMGFFDPQGLLAPFTIHGRMLVQELWRSGCQWDEQINEESFDQWKRWTGLLPEVEAVRIPRSYFSTIRACEIESLELHIFTDASQHAYGCVAYFRAVTSKGLRVSLVMSRSKVAPLKQQSIPRLELMAGVLGARMSQTIQANHTLPIDRCIFWTDSEVLLSWIASDARNYKQFVAFRTNEIAELTKVTDWRWISTKINIADVLTKWGQGPPLESDGQWFRGPSFLYNSEDHWPKQKLPAGNTEEELRACLLHHDITVHEPVINVHRISRWMILLRTATSVHRFISNCRRKKDGYPIVTTKAIECQRKLIQAELDHIELPFKQEEFRKAEVTLWRQAQQENFPDELKTLFKIKNGQQGKIQCRIEKSSALYKLTPILDEEGVLRMGGRLEKSEYIPFDMKFPIILPKDNKITMKLLQNFHEKAGHGNRETVVNEVRQQYWIPNVRAAVQQVMKTCMWCKVYRCIPKTPQMSPLPVQRITPHVRPFSSVGVDYLGPIEVTVRRRKEKRWVAVFTCLAVRAVHLDVVHSLSTQSCLMAIRRFICKRGKPEEFFSDNGTCFRGASKEVTKVKREIAMACAEYVTDARTKWHFNPPSTPHMGGIWERMVRSVKEAMKVLDDGMKLDDEILLTTLAEAEDMVNSRPLTYMPQESAENEAITPNHFLRGTVKGADMEVDGSVTSAEALREVYKRSQYLANNMWKRWYKEYLPTINQRTRWYEERNPVQEGDLVFVVDGKDRKKWVRGIIDKIVPASDGKVRQVDVKINGKVYRRAVTNLAVLEIGERTSGHPRGTVPEVRAGELSTPLGTTRTTTGLVTDSENHR